MRRKSKRKGPRVKEEYDIGEQIPISPPPRMDYGSRPYFPYGDPIVLYMGERVLARFIIEGEDAAEKILFKLIKQYARDPHECWRGFGVISLFVGGLGFKWSEKVHAEFNDSLIRFSRAFPNYPPKGYLLRYFTSYSVLEVVNALIKYSQKEWGMKIPQMNSFMVGWAGKWGYQWALNRIAYDMSPIEIFKSEEPEEKEAVPDGNGNNNPQTGERPETGTVDNTGVPKQIGPK
jgi:hypothetical protein